VLSVAAASSACVAGTPAPNVELAPSPVIAPYQTAPGGKACAREDASASEVRASLSRARAMVGAPPLDCDDSITTAAGAHARYLEANHEFGHTETPGKVGFTGVDVGDRLDAAHFEGACSGEVLSTLSGAASVDGEFGYLNTVYHRALLLRIESTTFGFGSASTSSVLDLGRPEDAHARPQRVVWPPDGATNVPTTFHASFETPNPVAPLDVVGSPVSLVTGHALTALAATLSGPSGPADFVLVTADDDPAKLVRVGEAHLVPKAPLQPNSTYVATFAFADAGEAVVLGSTFMTGDH
jgi:uncharacterized protein YkwD